MLFYSTNNRQLRIPFREALFQSLPADKGLYMPVYIPELSGDFIRDLENRSLQDIALEISSALLGEDIPQAKLEEIIRDAINFGVPLRKLDEDVSVLELFHGPSMAFKDFGARFMSRVMAYFAADRGDALLDVLVATSGDTGGAVALGFESVPNTRVTILYPRGKVSPIQEQQLTRNAGNIRALEVDGTFDDCQAMVKQAFNDPELKGLLNLTSANSINISRLIPQTFYYFHALADARRQGDHEVAFSVPSGNFGNVGAGLLAWKMGLPVRYFLAATNANDTVPRFLREGHYDPRPTIASLSNAMDVAQPSNWVRIMDLFGGDTVVLKTLLRSIAFDDKETKSGMRELYESYGYVACPHTAVAYLAARQQRKEDPGDYRSIVLSTAHPCKFPEAFDAEIASQMAIPEQVEALAERESKKEPLSNRYEEFKSFLTDYR